MRRTTNPNINSRLYWDRIYGSPSKRLDYEAQTNNSPVQDKDGNYHCARITGRFTKTLEFIKDGDRFLDLGCGVGLLTKLVKDTYPKAEVWGVDISYKAIQDNQAERDDVYYHQGYVGRLVGIPEAHFDIVFAGEILEHLDTPWTLLEDAYDVLKPGGSLIITTPLKDRIQSPEHVWEFEREDLEELYVQAGFEDPRFVYLDDMEHLLVLFAVGKKPQ